MKKRGTMNRNISLIIAGAVIMGQIPISALADGWKDVNVKITQKAEDKLTYDQEYSDHDSNSWKRLEGDGEVKENFDFADEENGVKGALEIKRNKDKGNKFVFVEDQSPKLKDFEAETRFQLNPAEGEKPGRFGLVFRGTSKENYGFVGYNGGESPGTWLIESSTDWKDNIKGPEIKAGEWVKMKVIVKRSNLTLIVNDKEIFSENITLDNFPTEEGQFGFRTWFDNKDVKVDYLKIKSLDGALVDDITEVKDVNVETLSKTKPELPYRVDVTYSDGTTGSEVVIWDYIDPSKYAEEGNFVVEGKIKGATDKAPKAKANITVREKHSYSTDFESEENSGDWKILKGSGTPSVTDGALKVPMNGVAVAADMKSPNVKNFTYETNFKVDNESGRIGLGFRIKDKDNWGAVCYDAGSWVWKAMNGAKESYGSFPGSLKLEANKNYKMKLRVEDNNISLWIDDVLLGNATSGSLPQSGGKIGLVGWFGNKNVTLDNLSVDEITQESEGDLPEVQAKTIESDKMKVQLDNTFPRVIGYEWKDDNSNLVGQEDRYNKVELNNVKYTPEVTCEVKDNVATYTLNIKEKDVTLTVKMSVEGNKLRMEVTDIKEGGDFKVQKVNFPNHSFATVKSNNGGAIAATLSTGAWHEITDEIKNVEDIDPSVKGKTYAFINDNDFAITMDNNVVEYSNRITLNTQNKNGYKSTGMGTGTWTYREVLDSETEFFDNEGKLWSEVMITKDMNDDKKVTWQDAAIEYRRNMKVPMGGDDIKNNLSYVAFNIAYTQNPFLRSLDTVKKISNYTDGFGQMVLHKGYQAEGHDDSIPDYGGHIGIRQGGKEDFNTLINEGKKYNAKIGVHVNATEYQKDAFQYPQNGSVNENAGGWNWLDQAYYVDQRADVVNGELFRRLDMLKKDAPDLGWVYVDVYTGNGWNAHQLGEKLNSLDYQVATEFHSPLEEHVTWTHWGADPAYPNKGGTSEILRFIKNDTKDGFLSDPLLKGNKHLLSGGWGTKHTIEGEYGTEVFYNQVLPTKYMQHFEIMSMTEDEVKFNEDLKAVREGADINYYKEGRLVATTPENSIGETGIGKTKLFLPWNPVEEDEKIYHWNPLGTTSDWELPKSWAGLANVELYELTDVGRTKVKSIDVVDGRVNLDVKKDTPYIVTKGEVKEERIDSWGQGAQIKDPGFDSQTWNVWNKESKSGATDHITFVNEDRATRKGNDVVSIKDKDGKIIQNIDGLDPGKTYSISAWVRNDGNREVTLGVNSGDEKVTNVITRAGVKRQGEGHKWIDDPFVRMEVEFTVPDGVKNAEIYLQAKEGTGDVIVDDFRIWDHPGHTNKDGYVFYEDFENVDEGITPFYLAPGRGHSNRTHLAEKDLYGRQKMNWVLDGRFSLKSNQQDGETGQMFITDSSTFDLEPNTKYELGFLYSLKNAKPGYSFNIKSKSGGTLVNIPLGDTAVESGKYTNSKEVTKTFTTGDKDDYYISVDKGNGYAELILDNVYVKEVKEDINSKLSNVNLNTVLNQLEVNLAADFSVNALMGNGEKVDLSKAEVNYIISDESVVSIEDGKIKGLKNGKASVQAEVIVNDTSVKSNKVIITVGESDTGNPEDPEVNKSALKMAIDYAKDAEKNGALEGVVPKVVKEFKDALKEAEEVYGNVSATTDQVDTVFKKLMNAIHMLEFKQGDKKELQKLVDIIDSLNKDEYISSTWTALEEQLENAKKVLEDANAMQAEVNESFDKLMKSYLDLRLKADKSKLEDLINEIENMDLSKYSEKSVKKLKAELEKAKKVLGDEEATQDQVDNTVKALEKAIDNLEEVEIPEVDGVNRAELEKAITAAEKLKEEDYTKKTFKEFKNALNKAKKVLLDEKATQEDVDSALKALNDAQSKLELNKTPEKPTEPNKPGDNGGKPNKPNKPINPTTPGANNGNGNIPATGMNTGAMGLIGVIASALGITFLKKKK